MMKKMVCYTLAAGLALGAGCKKGEDGSTEMMTPGEVADATQAAAVQATEKAAEVTEQAEAAVSAVAVKAEDVMADLNQSVEQVREKVAEFDQTQVLAYVEQYKTVLLEKKDQLEDVALQLKSLSMTEMMSEKATMLKEEIAQYTDQINALKERYSIYLDRLEAFGVDLSAYRL